ncbi:unnamed protein product, partial [Mesorhabditis belari]|uniref:TPM domain-containing protein n=1 Tax=Mesorhabditis belari TaxID=2138241 RepID=A0AAF3ETU1_9BILA
MRKIVVLLLAFYTVPIFTQYTSQTYPDPRNDPFSCRMGFPSGVCDPSSVLSDEERTRLAQRLVGVTSSIRNSAPSCSQRPDANLQLVVAVLDKIGAFAGAQVDVEKFANNLKRRYQNYQDIGICDTFVLIVNSRQDRQVFTVAGRDAKISKETLKRAFESNIGHFKSNKFALGLEGMVEMITAAYSNAHIVQVPTPVEGFVQENLESSIPAASQQSFRASAVLTKTQESFEELVGQVPDEDRAWVDIMSIAVARCGESGDLMKSIRSVVEEAMAISVKLISDSRYNGIEEEVETNKDILGIRDSAWKKAAIEWITPLFQRYKEAIRAGGAQVCPALNPHKILTSPNLLLRTL